LEVKDVAAPKSLSMVASFMTGLNSG